MAELKTKKTTASVAAFIDAVENDVRRADARTVLKLMREVTGEKPALWGRSIVGFGVYESPTVPWPIAGFSPRKANLALYIMPGFAQFGTLLGKLGKHRTGASCLYVNKLADVDMAVLRKLVEQSVAAMRNKYCA